MHKQPHTAPKILLLSVCRFVLAVLSFFSSTLGWSATCDQVFPDGASSHKNGGSINIYWDSRIENSPDGVLDTRDLNDFAAAGTSCDSASCGESGTTAAQGDFNNFPGGSDVNIPAPYFLTLAPGDYDDLNVGSFATLELTGGVYTFFGSASFQWLSNLQVQAGQVAVVYVKGDIDVGTANINNPTGGSLLLYSRRDISLNWGARVNAAIFADRHVNLQNNTIVTGAASAGGNLNLYSGSTVVFDSSIAHQDFDVFCTGAPAVLPDPVGYWQFDELTWDGSANEVQDESGNGIHGRAIDLDGFPSTQADTPAISGNPGTCRSGDFNGTSDGYAQIDDPGTNSLLDNNEFTWTFWFYPRSFPPSSLYAMISKDFQSEVNIRPSGVLHWWWGGGNQQLDSTQSVALNTWQHLAITYRQGQQQIYLDGTLIASHNSNDTLNFNNYPIYVGTDYNRHSRRFDGYVDELQVFDSVLSGAQIQEVMAQTHTCADEPSIADFVIDVGSGTGSTCVAKEVGISIVDGGGQALTDFTGTINVSTSSGSGDWSKTATASDAYGTITPGAADSGSATYQFAADQSDQGQIRLQILNTHQETLTVTVESGGVSRASSNIVFSENAFVWATSDSLGDDLIAGRPHAYQISMIKSDPLTGDCGVAAGYDVSDVKVWLSRAANDPGGVAPSITNSDSSQTLSLPASQPGTANFTANFVNGLADITLTAGDVGEYSVNVRDDSASFADSAIVGGSDTALIARPFAVEVQVVGNPQATDASGPVLGAAGDPFTVSARAVAWQSADDADDNGIADGHDDTDVSNNADLSNNASVVSFAQEISAEGLQLSAALVEPVGGNSAALTSTATAPADGTQLTAFVSGTGTTAQVTYPEVGIVEISASLLDANYLSASSAFSAKILGKSGVVGRFTPKYFRPVLAVNSVDPFCSSVLAFSYMSQPFDVRFTAEALNSNDVITTNYRGDFARLNQDSHLSFGAVDSSVTDLSSRISFSGATFSANNGDVEVVVPLQLNRIAAPDGPYMDTHIGASVSDVDGIEWLAGVADLDVDSDTIADHVDVAQTYIKYGRLYLADSYGPEIFSMPVTFQTQYWDGQEWLVNTDDDCSEILLSDIQYPSGSIDVTSNLTVTVGAGSTIGSYGVLNAGSIGFVSGDAVQSFSPPGAGNTGSFLVDVSLTNTPWLSYDWNEDGNYSDTALPSAQFHFGVYRGHDKVIYWREVLQ